MITRPKEGWSSFFVSTWQLEGTGGLVGGIWELERNNTYTTDMRMRHILGQWRSGGGGQSIAGRPGSLNKAYPEQINQCRHGGWCCCLYRQHKVHVFLKNTFDLFKHLRHAAVLSEMFLFEAAVVTSSIYDRSHHWLFVERVTHADEPTEKYHPTLKSLSAHCFVFSGPVAGG